MKQIVKTKEPVYLFVTYKRRPNLQKIFNKVDILGVIFCFIISVIIMDNASDCLNVK